MTKHTMAVCGLVLAFVFGVALLQQNAVHAEDKTVTGTVSCEKDGDGNVKSVSVKCDDGTKYSVTNDDNGKKLAKEMDGKKATVSGDVTEKDEQKWLKVASYKAAE